jgi:replicative superfamily II helicase
MHRVEGMNEVVFHSSQAAVYNHLMDGKNVILSAPTSYGKSLIIDSMIASDRYNNIVIIVPSIALIDETRKRLSAFKGQYKIVTYPYQKLAERNVLVLTQERAVEVIEQVKVDFFVIDEFYKIGSRTDGDERYRILNQVFYKLVKTGAQFYLLGPNIENVKTGSLENIQFEFIKTDFKTVVSERHQVTIHSDRERIEKLVDILNNTDQPTLVYCQSPSSANRLATQLLEYELLKNPLFCPLYNFICKHPNKPCESDFAGLFASIPLSKS